MSGVRGPFLILPGFCRDFKKQGYIFLPLGIFHHRGVIVSEEAARLSASGRSLLFPVGAFKVALG